MKSPDDASRKQEGARCTTGMAISETNLTVSYLQLNNMDSEEGAGLLIFYSLMLRKPKV